ncbi:MAG: hypothetical protein ABL958_15530 [Bdellovibrionia bacterium]
MDNVTREKSNNVKGAVLNLEKVAHDAGEKIGTIASDFAHSTSDMAKSASDYVVTGREYVKENPFKGVAIAAVAGVVAGGILAMAMSRR